MIMNPVLSGGGEKRYKITDKVGFMLSGDYEAGHVVTSRELTASLNPIVILAADGTEIPYFTNTPNRISLLFIMPAQDVTIGYDGGGIHHITSLREVE